MIMATVSPIFQVTKIQMRQGVSSTLPGAPITLTPPTFTEGLDVGEIGFATDTSRLFIGASQTVGQVNYQRTTFPYQNIEVLTETSPVIPQVVGAAFKNLSAYGFYSASLGPSSSWSTVAGAPSLTGEICAKMEYFAFNSSTEEPLRQGTQRILATSGASQATVLDDSVSTLSAYTVAPPAPPLTPTIATTFGFQFIRNGSNFTMQYVNNLSATILLFFAFAAPQP